MSKRKKPRGYYVWAVATKQPDGSWYPWPDTAHRVKEVVASDWALDRGGMHIEEDTHFKIKRFRMVTA